MPGSRFGTAYPPVSAVTTVRVKPVLCDVTVMVAPGSPRLLASTTRPLMDACCWAKAGTATRQRATTQRTRKPRHMKGPPKLEAWRARHCKGYRVRSVFGGSGCCKRAFTAQQCCELYVTLLRKHHLHVRRNRRNAHRLPSCIRVVDVRVDS